MKSLPVRRPPGLPAILAALSAVGPLSVDTYLPSMGEIGRVLHATPIEVQQTLTAYMTTFAVMTLWHGAISDAVGRRAVILWCTAIYLVSTAACIFAPTIGALTLFRALQGVTAGAGMVVGRAVIRDMYDGAEAQRLMSHVTLVFAIAPAVAPIVGGWLEVSFGWRSVFVFLLLFGCTAWMLCRQLLPETLPKERRQPLHPGYLARSYLRVLTSPAFVAVCLGMTLNFAGIFIYIVSAPIFLMKHLQLTETGFLWLFGPVTIGMATGAWLSSRMAGRSSIGRTLVIGYVVMGLSSIANVAVSFGMKPSLPWSVLPLLTYSFGMSLLFPTLTLLALDLFPAQRGLAASCQSFVQTAGAAVISIVVTLIWGSTGSLALWQAIILVAGGALTSLYLFLRRGVPATVGTRAGKTPNEAAAKL
jgi:DHA1 family bicyclomycin/chloramphenicol resistance-like MFS transporter